VKPLVFILHGKIRSRLKGNYQSLLASNFSGLSQVVRCGLLAHEMMLAMNLLTSNIAATQVLSAAEFAQRVRYLRWALMTVWASVSFGTAFFARDLSFVWMDRPFGFWMAAQGSVLMFLAITVIYAVLVNRWGRQTQTASEEASDA
jgi:putative solute:sodium symporter small subunit